jgi:hypothetical protein
MSLLMALTPEKISIGTGIVNTNRQVGFVLGTSVVVAVIGTPSSPHAALASYRAGWAFIVVISLAAAAVGTVAARRR